MNDKFVFRVNVGFLINQAVGTSREMTIECPEMILDEDGLKAEKIRLDLRVSRVQQGILAEGTCCGDTELECTRCLEAYTQHLESHFEELFYFHYLRENEDAEQFLPENGYMDLYDIVREYLIIEIPYAPVCKPECKGLCPICGNNLNLGPCSHPAEEE